MSVSHYLVRVVSGLHGAYMNDKGETILTRKQRDQNDGIVNLRNTIHFSVDGPVSEHAEGANWDACSIAIIAAAGQTKTPPTGMRFEDTYFHYDENGEFNAGKAVLVAPAGMELPGGMSVIRYKPGDDPTASRNAAINRFVAVAGESKSIGMHGVVGASMIENDQMLSDLHESTYPGKLIQNCSHAASLDGNLEDAIQMLEVNFSDFKQGTLSFRNGQDHETIDLLNQSILNVSNKIAAIKTSGIEGFSVSSGYFSEIDQRILQIESEKESIHSQRTANLDRLERAIRDTQDSFRMFRDMPPVLRNNEGMPVATRDLLDYKIKETEQALAATKASLSAKDMLLFEGWFGDIALQINQMQSDQSNIEHMRSFTPPPPPPLSVFQEPQSAPPTSLYEPSSQASYESPSMASFEY